MVQESNLRFSARSGCQGRARQRTVFDVGFLALTRHKPLAQPQKHLLVPKSSSNFQRSKAQAESLPRCPSFGEAIGVGVLIQGWPRASPLCPPVERATCACGLVNRVHPLYLLHFHALCAVLCAVCVLFQPGFVECAC